MIIIIIVNQIGFIILLNFIHIFIYHFKFIVILIIISILIFPLFFDFINEFFEFTTLILKSIFLILIKQLVLIK